ncbi:MULTISPECIES: hypothetical protein [unclassified Microbacterium]|uniref:hypothetical protein n=1 Tax=unclassified Microbacterium TaxID=2609290 RepID=UPI001604DBB0|nr:MULTISPECIES: hypothetical protein [unclassified Microbacterium]QNA93239.1 hypothetical protein G4G29_14635 [Microbacterium sp. Se63.02b]QYM63448.1 hypothetical protein K1X59_14685 [Microbacterium sp. Se5.02b]
MDENLLDVLDLVALMDPVAAFVPAHPVVLRPEAHGSPASRVRGMPINVTVEMPFDFVGAVLVPSLSVLVSAGIALWAVSRERVRAEEAALRAQAAELIKALNAIGRAYAVRDTAEMDRANARYEQEVNAFGAHLRSRDVPVVKYINAVVHRSEDQPDSFTYRTMLWLATAIELWLRGALRTKDFIDNMPSGPSAWIDFMDLGDHDAIVRGMPARGVPDIDTDIEDTASAS